MWISSSGSDDDLLVIGAFCPDPLGPADGLDGASMEDGPDVGVIVECDHPGAAQGGQSLPETVNIRDVPRAVKGGRAVGIWRIEEKECGRAVPDAEASFPIEILDRDAVQADVELADGIHAGSSGSGSTGA